LYSSMVNILPFLQTWKKYQSLRRELGNEFQFVHLLIECLITISIYLCLQQLSLPKLVYQFWRLHIYWTVVNTLQFFYCILKVLWFSFHALLHLCTLISVAICYGIMQIDRQCHFYQSLVTNLFLYNLHILYKIFKKVFR
jgi:hypothetical protein